ncbi:hypothetical protein FACS1894111_10390 [Clostridia bacterium]|nr:hypothetical protein FACS1894111_10390 [Clostridia bacterium]
MAIKEVIERTVERTILALRERDRVSSNPLKSTQNRLYAFPVLQERGRLLRAHIEEIMTCNEYSLRRSRPWLKQMPHDEIRTALIKDIDADLANDELELKMIDEAVRHITAGEKHGDIINLYYFEGKSDEEIAKLNGCHSATIRKKRNALVQALAVFLYGVAAN